MKQQTSNKIKADIHNFDRRLASVFTRLKAELSPENMQLVNRYYHAIIIDTAGKAVQEKHLQTILMLSRMYQENWQDIKREDVDNLLLEISKKYSDAKGQETHTSFDYKKILKIFVRWIKTGNRRKDPDIPDPIEIKGIKLRRVKDRLSREDLITETDLSKLIHACGENMRDKAFISVHSEAGTRIGETLTLQIKHVVKDKLGAIIKVDGKTTARPIRLVKSLPYLAAWLNSHPFRNNPDAPLWINLSHHGYGDQISYEGVKRILEKRAKLAGLEKRIFFHLFRHSEITETANFLTEAQLRKRYGWSGSSKMPERYTHLVDSDVDKAILGHYGLIKKDEQQTALLPKICSICEFPNAHDAKFCSKCTKALDLQAALEEEEKQKQVQQDKDDEVKRLRQAVDYLMSKDQEAKNHLG
ncbi:MAG: tyrosine-type recombinase/integrase [Patescibacteria group bacterium]|nr:tyrosine-type recombinase/integrase [Patescibacteria group bacterium]